MDPETALGELVRVEAEIARLHAVQAELLVAVADPAPRVEEYRVWDPRPGHDAERVVRIEDAVREEVAAALRWSPATAQARIDAARLLHGPLADTRAALESGEISYAHARIVVEAAERFSCRLAADRAADAGADPAARVRFGWQCARLQDRVLPVARRSTLARTRAAAARAVDRFDATGQAARRRAARTRRDVWVGAECDGIAPLVAHLDALTARAIHAAVQATADQATGTGTADQATTDQATTGTGEADPRTAGERRADALAALILGQDSPVTVTAEVQVAIPVDQLVGERAGLEADGLAVLLADPAIEATVRPVLVDPDGHVLDVGRRAYALPAALRRLITTRDTTCRFPGCARAATSPGVQIDHAHPWDDGGPSDVANLGVLCTRHHQLKTHTRWDITHSQPDGTCTWTSPAGRTHHHDPPPF